MSESHPVGIVGAGLSGLCLARSLSHEGIDCFVLDKGRLPGGRLATVMSGDLPIEYGPGWFVSGESAPDSAVEQSLRSAQASELKLQDLPDGARARTPASGRSRAWSVARGMRHFAAELADSLEVHQSHHVRRIERMRSSWRISGTVAAEHDRPFVRDAGALVLTQPWPQVRALLNDSGLRDISLPAVQPDEKNYERVILLILESADFPVSPGSPLVGEADGVGPIRNIRWQSASPSGRGRILTVFADPRWSETWWDADELTIRSNLIEALESFFGQRIEASLIRQHRWKFAKLSDPTFGNPQPCILADRPLLIAAGEAFGVTPESPAGLLSAQESARLAAMLLVDRGTGLSGP